MKYQLFKAVDKLDGELSLFLLAEDDSYTVVEYSDALIGKLVKAIKNGRGCDWQRGVNETPRRDDMIDPVLLCVLEGE